MRNHIEEVKLSTDARSLAESLGFEFRERGNLLIAKCRLPGHEDNNPSFVLYPDQHFYCYGCTRYGDSIDLVAYMNGTSVADALRIMRNSPGQLAQTPPPLARLSKSKRFRPDSSTLTKMARLYSWILREHPDGAPARRYLAARGIETDTKRSDRLRVGYCPSDRASCERFRAAGVSLPHARRSGLMVCDTHPESETERFGGRIVLSELDPRGSRVVYMTGRLIADDLGESPKFDALPGPKLPLGLHALIRRPPTETLYIVEGLCDWLALSQWGLAVVATLGGNVSERMIGQLTAVARSRPTIIAFDRDVEGVRSADRLKKSLSEASGNTPTLAALPPDCSDPADVAERYGTMARDTFLRYAG